MINIELTFMDWYNLFLNTITAIGTVGATIVALWLALQGNMRRIDGTFIWEAATSYQPTLLVQNTSNRIVVIESIEIRYRNKKVCFVEAADDLTLAKHVLIEVGHIQKIPMGEYDFEFKKPTNSKKKYSLKVIIKQRNGRNTVSVAKYSYDELQGLIFGQGLCKED